MKMRIVFENEEADGKKNEELTLSQHSHQVFQAAPGNYYLSFRLPKGLVSLSQFGHFLNLKTPAQMK